VARAAAIALRYEYRSSGWHAVQSRVIDGRVAPLRLAQERLVGCPQIEHHVPLRAGAPTPSSVARGARELGPSPARPPRSSTGRSRARSRPAVGRQARLLADRPHRRLRRAAHRPAPADVGQAEHPRDGIVEDDREAVGAEDGERRTALGCGEDVDQPANPPPAGARPTRLVHLPCVAARARSSRRRQASRLRRPETAPAGRLRHDRLRKRGDPGQCRVVVACGTPAPASRSKREVSRGTAVAPPAPSHLAQYAASHPRGKPTGPRGAGGRGRGQGRRTRP